MDHGNDLPRSGANQEMEELKPQEHSAPHSAGGNTIIIYGGVHNSPIQQGTTGSHQVTSLPVPQDSQSRSPTDASFGSIQAQCSDSQGQPHHPHDPDFTDITIVGFDEIQSRLLGRGVLEAFIELSAEPPQPWVTFLRHECQLPRGTMMRPLHRLEGKSLVLHDAYGGTSLSDYLEGLKGDVQNANQMYQEALHRQQQEQRRQDDAERQGREHLAQLKSQLNI